MQLKNSLHNTRITQLKNSNSPTFGLQKIDKAKNSSLDNVSTDK